MEEAIKVTASIFQLKELHKYLLHTQMECTITFEFSVSVENIISALEQNNSLS